MRKTFYNSDFKTYFPRRNKRSKRDIVQHWWNWRLESLTFGKRVIFLLWIHCTSKHFNFQRELVPTNKQWLGLMRVRWLALRILVFLTCIGCKRLCVIHWTGEFSMCLTLVQGVFLRQHYPLDQAIFLLQPCQQFHCKGAAYGWSFWIAKTWKQIADDLLAELFKKKNPPKPPPQANSQSTAFGYILDHAILFQWKGQNC